MEEIGNRYLIWGHTEVEVVGVVGAYYRVKNLSAGHTTSYTFEDWTDTPKNRIVTPTDILKSLKNNYGI